MNFGKSNCTSNNIKSKCKIHFVKCKKKFYETCIGKKLAVKQAALKPGWINI